MGPVGTGAGSTRLIVLRGNSGSGKSSVAAGVRARYGRGIALVGQETERIVRSLPIDHAVPVPRDVPWFPAGTESWTVRWVLLHLIEETARHAGHADILRELIDGRTGR